MPPRNVPGPGICPGVAGISCDGIERDPYEYSKRDRVASSVYCPGGTLLATLTGSVAHKRLKRDIGEIAWAIPAINDVQNNVTISPRRRRVGREGEPPQSPRKG